MASYERLRRKGGEEVYRVQCNGFILYVADDEQRAKELKGYEPGERWVAHFVMDHPGEGGGCRIWQLTAASREEAVSALVRVLATTLVSAGRVDEDEDSEDEEADEDEPSPSPASAVQEG